MSAPASRRAILLGFALAPIAGTAVAVALPDPHIALAEEAVALWRQSKAKAWGWGSPDGTPEGEAATAAHQDFMDRCYEIAELPAPRTLPGLRALAVTMALLHEGTWTETLCSFEASAFQFLESVLAFTGDAMPEGYAGLLYRQPVNVVEGGKL